MSANGPVHRRAVIVGYSKEYSIQIFMIYDIYKQHSISIGYLDNLRSRERIGSSQKYGHLFENEGRYLDSISKTLPIFEQN